MPQDLLKTAQGLNGSMEALAALGAMLKLRTGQLSADPAVTALLERVMTSLDLDVAGAAPGQQVVTLGFIRAFFAQAIDLLDHPERPPGWVYEDPAILQAQGLASRIVVRTMEAFAREDARFAGLLAGERRLLDIGSGVGWLAIEAAQTWRNMQVTGIDVFDPALALALDNLAKSSVRDRVAFRKEDVAALAQTNHYDVVWFPGPFIPRHIAEPALDRIRLALKPGGAIVFGFFGAPTPLAEALTDLRVVRAGGHPWTAPAISETLALHGFEAIRVVAPQSLATLVIGYRPVA